jgi:methylisocitrate lyase
LRTRQEFRDFARAIQAPLMANMTEFGHGPLLTVKELAAMGYRLVIFPQTAFRVAMKSTEACLRDLKRRGSQKSWLDRMQTRQELYDLLGYDPGAQ